jgi:hypothetical protein
MRATTSSFVAGFPLCTTAADEAALTIRLDAERNIYNASLRRLAAERKRAHGELANRILVQGTTIKTEKLSYKSI